MYVLILHVCNCVVSRMQVHYVIFLSGTDVLAPVIGVFVAIVLVLASGLLFSVLFACTRKRAKVHLKRELHQLRPGMKFGCQKGG